MAYLTPGTGLGSWYNPFSWGEPSEDEKRRLAGDVRYSLQLYQWTRQMRLWLYADRTAHQDDARVYADRTERLGKLVDLENQLEPNMQQIREAQSRVSGMPADLGFRWPGWQGDTTTPPTPPPAATPVTDAELNSGLSGDAGPSYWCYAIGAALIAIGIILLAVGTGGLALVAAAIVAGIVLTIAGTEGVQDMFSSPGLTTGVGNGVMWTMIIAASAVAWFLLRKRPQRTQSK